ncbi:CD302 antigen isoform X2 [Hemicordylus capensis]|uniref:CD302 antigen isoform X2 n=1 Tax=Hemicordylus capensis TaxID=884348 RepID=UPI0023048A70|nr:CD302 antigen isoform X2 [Hemicordylus capensis]
MVAGQEPVCPSSAWISFGNSCYALFQGTWESIGDARDLCKGNASGADIVSINNKEENTFILKSFLNHWHGPEYISLGMFFDADDDVFRWYDNSNVNFTNWMEGEHNVELLNTCACMHTRSGGWKKMSCEQVPLTGILCETAVLYEKKYLPDNKVWTSTVVILSTVIMSVAAALLWFLYQRRISSGTRWTVNNSTTQVPHSDEVVLIEEENEYIA